MVDRADFYDAELHRYNGHLQTAARVGVDDRVLDIGCGTGQTTREAARAAPQGFAAGVDVSMEMLEIARGRSDQAGLRNIAFEQGDAQHHAFPIESFDLCLSRFGVMFFADPAAAFANIARAMRPGGRLAWMVWQRQEYNEWSTAIRRALARDSLVSPTMLDPFSLGDPTVAEKLLRPAGFASIEFVDIREPVFYGPDVDSALASLADLYLGKNGPATTDVSQRERLQRLRDLLEGHLTAQGVLFDSRSWIITASKVG
ncbi:methyltransferase domain-containing protein (plasmid) [Agrobacterium leguminum]|uniref:Methylase involved in ubiquinone/menaquinone biosynthesis n=1 Tax=Agrobacterium deltaense NCPPB 1641 TaxID=1183425 RepID=A0A1S7U759_9HYPH|nr:MULTISPECIES: class I SAM-dependent methyltransferase [Agrobacterium]WFS69821.1 methyltransferase domain-containing protein [Agrobacterium leguminum]CVI62649.1 Methylase involved in ubiquinone/menaquinone biosynthesis [Agrobacterium deltaense NCPPB 1641]